MNVGDAVGEREGDFLDGGRTSFADVVAGDGDGVPLGQIIAAPGEDVGDDAHSGADGIDVGAAGDVFLEDVVLYGAGNFGEVGTLFFGNGDVEAEKDCGGGVDGHGSGNFFERNAIEKSFHVFERIDSDADFADFAESERVVGVHADLRGKIEGDREAGLAFAEEVAIALVGFDGAAEAGVLAHGPEAAAVHGGVNAARVREFAGIADGGFGIGGGKIVLCVEAVDGKTGKSCEVLFAFGGGFGFCVRHFCVNIWSQPRTRQKPERARHAVPLQGIDYNLRARRNDVTAKKKNKKAKATAVAMSQRATSRVQERRARFSHARASTAKHAPAISRKSWRKVRQKRWKPPWRGAAAGEVAAEDMSAS